MRATGRPRPTCATVHSNFCPFKRPRVWLALISTTFQWYRQRSRLDCIFTNCSLLPLLTQLPTSWAAISEWYAFLSITCSSFNPFSPFSAPSLAQPNKCQSAIIILILSISSTTTCRKAHESVSMRVFELTASSQHSLLLIPPTFTPTFSIIDAHTLLNLFYPHFYSYLPFDYETLLFLNHLSTTFLPATTFFINLMWNKFSSFSTFNFSLYLIFFHCNDPFVIHTHLITCSKRYLNEKSD